MDELITELPFKDVVEIAHLDDNHNSSNSIHFRMSTNNDFLIEIDPDHNSSPNCVEKQYKYDDTLNEFNQAMSFHDNISILHTNICSSEHKCDDFMNYVNNLNIKFSFIGISETWATKHNDHLLIIIIMNNVYVRIRKGVVVQVYIFIMIYSIRQELIYLYPINNTNQY